MKTSFRDFPVVGTEFSQYETEYFLNKDNMLEAYPAPRDTQAVIDASKETIFQRILEQLSEVPEMFNNPAADYIENRENYASDLDILMQADEIMDNYKSDHPDFKGTKADIYKNIKKEVERSYADYEAQNKTEKESEQKELSPDGETSAQA